MNVFQERGITHLDLHGERHFDVAPKILDFVFREVARQDFAHN